MKRKVPLLLCALAMMAVILDSRCATEQAAQGVEQCVRTVIPALFPLFVLSGVMGPGVQAVRLPGLTALLGIPAGSEGIFLLGLVGGYPMGAQCIAQAVERGSLDRESARRMLGLCNNCGPAFLFGILGSKLGSARLCVAAFVIQAVSAVLTGALSPRRDCPPAAAAADSVSLPQAVDRAVKAMAKVCAWVVLARVLVGYLQRWLFPFLPRWLGVVLCGGMELTTGTVALAWLGDADLRFVLGCGFISFGGCCVLLQIRSIAAPAGVKTDSCIRQKCVQCAIAMLLAMLWVRHGGAAAAALTVIFLFLKKTVENRRILVYNDANRGGI